MMTAREQAIVRMHNAGLSDAEIVAVMAMRGKRDEEAILIRVESKEYFSAPPVRITCGLRYKCE